MLKESNFDSKCQILREISNFHMISVPLQNSFVSLHAFEQESLLRHCRFSIETVPELPNSNWNIKMIKFRCELSAFLRHFTLSYQIVHTSDAPRELNISWCMWAIDVCHVFQFDLEMMPGFQISYWNTNIIKFRSEMSDSRLNVKYSFDILHISFVNCTTNAFEQDILLRYCRYLNEIVPEFQTSHWNAKIIKSRCEISDCIRNIHVHINFWDL